MEFETVCSAVARWTTDTGKSSWDEPRFVGCRCCGYVGNGVGGDVNAGGGGGGGGGGGARNKRTDKLSLLWLPATLERVDLTSGSVGTGRGRAGLKILSMAGVWTAILVVD
jgi:hypothetical protein